MTFIPAQTANVSQANSTTTALAGGATFTGTPEDVSQYASLSVSFYVQPYTATGNVLVQFSNTASPFYAVSNTVTAVTSLTSNGFTLDTTMTAQYFRVTYINDSTPQTAFMIQSIYHPQARIAVKSDRLTVPMNNFSDLINTRSVMAAQTLGSNPTVEIMGSNGNQSLNVCINDPRTAFNEVSVAVPQPLAQVDFVYGINSLVSSSNLVSNASVTASSGLLRVTSNGASTQSAAIYYAKKFVKYRAGQGTNARMTCIFSPPATVNGSIAVAGVGFAVANTTTMIDFAGFGYGNVASSTQFGILWRNNTRDAFIPQTEWNFDTCLGGTKSGYLFQPTSLNSFQIQFQYCGNILFYVENPNTGRYILVHSIPTNLLAPLIPNFQNPTLQMMWYSNSAATSSNTLTVYGASGGHFLEGHREFTSSRGATYNPTTAALPLNTETMILAVKNATYYGTNAQNVIPCRSQIHLRGFSVSATGFGSTTQGNQVTFFSPAPATITFRQIRNPTSGGPQFWTPYSGTNQSDADGSNIYGQSTLSSNIAPLTGITGGATGYTITVACGGEQFIDFEQFESVAYPGDVLCFVANVNSVFATSNVTVSAALTWNEDV
jgi:hypothetical protein